MHAARDTTTASNRTTMKRLCLSVLLLVVLGAMATVGVAWLSAVTVNVFEGGSPAEWRQVRTPGLPGTFWQGQRKARAGGVWFAARHVRSKEYDFSDSGEFRGDDAVPSWSGFAVPPPEYVSGDADAVWRWGEGRGWPMIALWCELRRYDDLHSERKVHPVRGGIQTSLSDWGGGIAHNTDPRVLPLLPVWSGFAVDTVFYATVLGLFRAPFVVRRFLRRRRGRCPSCGYLASDSPVCTECGAVLGNRANP
jgi:hypothetical protein